MLLHVVMMVTSAAVVSTLLADMTDETRRHHMNMPEMSVDTMTEGALTRADIDQPAASAASHLVLLSVAMLM